MDGSPWGQPQLTKQALHIAMISLTSLKDQFLLKMINWLFNCTRPDNNGQQINGGVCHMTVCKNKCDGDKTGDLVFCNTCDEEIFKKKWRKPEHDAKYAVQPSGHKVPSQNNIVGSYRPRWSLQAHEKCNYYFRGDGEMLPQNDGLNWRTTFPQIRSGPGNFNRSVSESKFPAHPHFPDLYEHMLECPIQEAFSILEQLLEKTPADNG